MTEAPPISTLDDAAAIAQRALDRAEMHPGASVVLTPYVVRLLLDAQRKFIALNTTEQAGPVLGIGFAHRKGNDHPWAYVFDRAPDSFELRECEIKHVQVVHVSPRCAGHSIPLDGGPNG